MLLKHTNKREMVLSSSVCVCSGVQLITHISRAPVLDHSDDVSELHLQSERCLPLRFHFNVLSHLSNYWVHPLRDSDICELDSPKSTCLSAQVGRFSAVLPAYTSGAPEKHQDLLEIWIWADQSNQMDNWSGRTYKRHTTFVK